MQTNKFGEPVLDQDDLCDLVLQGRDVTELRDVCVDPSVDTAALIRTLTEAGNISSWRRATPDSVSIEQYDQHCQQQWQMPQQYRDLDIAALVLDLCQGPEELQRAGRELMMFQERDMMDVLRYMKYLVDQMREHHIIWGVGRGSSVASFVLYLLGVHRINSLYYELDPGEFLR
jgi:DNA polymerase III alpha subunit